jgi:hypothetical protein
METIYTRLPMLVVIQQIGDGPLGLVIGAVLSRAEFLRRGITTERIHELMGTALRSATDGEVENAKRVVGVTSEVESRYTVEIEGLRVLQSAGLEQAGLVPSKVASLLYTALHDWRKAETAYLEKGRVALPCHALPYWQTSVRQGFDLDRDRAELAVIAEHIKKCVGLLLPPIGRLSGITAEPLQRLVRSIDLHGKEPNSDWSDAEIHAEVLPGKLEDLEVGSGHPVRLVGQTKPIETVLHEPTVPRWKRIGKRGWWLIASCVALLAAIAGLADNAKKMLKLIKNPTAVFRDDVTTKP